MAFGVIVYIINVLIKELTIAKTVFLEVLFEIYFSERC